MAISLAQLRFAEPSPLARRLLWHVLSAGSVTRDEPERHGGQDKPGWFLFWVVSGGGRLQLEHRTLELKPGPRCWLLDLRQPRAYLPAPGRKLVTASIRFSGLGMDVWREALGAHEEFAFRQARDWTRVRQAQQRILKLVQRRPAGYEWRIHRLLGDLLGQLLRVRGALAAREEPVSAPVRRVLDAVLADPLRDWRAKELGTVAGLSDSALRSQFKRSQQESLHAFLQRHRLDQARLLLGDPRLSVKQVAERLHFSSDVYFSHFFRRATGLTPRRFRLQGRTY
jgi:AraC-like DNA-binding protein